MHIPESLYLYPVHTPDSSSHLSPLSELLISKPPQFRISPQWILSHPAEQFNHQSATHCLVCSHQYGCCFIAVGTRYIWSSSTCCFTTCPWAWQIPPCNLLVWVILQILTGGLSYRRFMISISKITGVCGNPHCHHISAPVILPELAPLSLLPWPTFPMRVVVREPVPCGQPATNMRWQLKSVQFTGSGCDSVHWARKMSDAYLTREAQLSQRDKKVQSIRPFPSFFKPGIWSLFSSGKIRIGKQPDPFASQRERWLPK